MQISTDGARINARVDGSGNAAVLLHGFPFHAAIWDRTASLLAATMRVISIDLRGCGSSSAPPGPYLMEALAGDVAAVLDSLGVETALIAGHSLGGYVALAFARMYSERLRALALVCSSLAADTAEQRAARMRLAAELETENDIEAVLRIYEPRLFSPETQRAQPLIVEQARDTIRQLRPQAAAALLRGMALRDPADDIARELTMPVEIIAGDRDPLMAPGQPEAMAAVFPAGSVTRLSESDHLPMLEQPQALAQAVAALNERAAT